MATLIGVVSQVIGQVFAIGTDGSRRQVHQGDRLFAGEQLDTGADGAVAVHLQNGKELTLGRDSEVTLNQNMLGDTAPHVATQEVTAPSQAELTDVQKIQQAIAAGADPTQAAEATAAGPAAAGTPAQGGEAGGGHSFVLLTETGGSIDPVVGFPTAGFNGVPEFTVPQVAALTNTNAAVVLVDNPVTLTGLTGDGAGVSVNEANLVDGSSPLASALTQANSFTVSAPDGLSSLSVGGITVVNNGVVVGVGQSITTGLGNTLTITGYNPTTGQVSYSYTLTGPDNQSSGGGANTVTENLPVTATDSNGSSSSGSVVVSVVDDVPQAINDNPTTPATEQNLVLTGNVLTNDIQGADRISITATSGPITAGTYTGTYGTLVLAADGSYTYTLNAAGQAFNDLHGGGTGTDSFTYTLSDADGDTSTAVLTLNIANINDQVTITAPEAGGLSTTVNEANLADGSAPNAAALVQNGQFTVSAPDGLQTLTVGGVAVVTNGVGISSPVSVVTQLGTLTINSYNPTTGVVSYSYTLTHADTHPDVQGANGISETFAVVATDTDGSSATSQLTATVVDDVPQAIVDNPTTAATEQNLVLTGNVLTNDVQGADRIAVTSTSGPITAGTYTGTYGTLVLAADGSYTYTLNAAGQAFHDLHGGGTGTETFTYTLSDADGDTSTAVLTLNIANINDQVTITAPEAGGLSTTVNEANLADGSAPNAAALVQNGQFTVSAPDGLQTLTVGGVAVVTNGVGISSPVSVVTQLGTLTINSYNPTTGVVSYSYTLTHADTHPDVQGANGISETFAVVATDTDGSTATSQLTATVVDDVPQAIVDNPTTAATEQNLVLTGNVLTNDVQGADRIAVTSTSGPITAGTYTGTYGTLVLAADGSYTYTLNAAGQAFHDLHGGGTGTETFTYTLSDADGDTSTAVLTLNIANINDQVTITAPEAGGLSTTVNEANLADGSAPNAAALVQNGQFTVSAPDGLQTLTVGGVAVVTNGVGISSPVSVVTQLGTLTINSYNPTTGVVSYSYTLTHADTHPDVQGANSISETFAVVATDTDGSTATSQLTATIVDDVPKAVADTESLTEGQTLLTGNVLSNDASGADGFGGVVGVKAGSSTSTVTTGVGVAIAGDYGVLTIAADGSTTYHANPNVANNGSVTDVFTYSVADKDGDISTTTLTITITDAGLKATNVDDVTVFEAALPTGSHPDSPLESGSGTVVGYVTGGVGALTYSLAGADSNGNVSSQYGTLHLNADGTYTYTLNTAPQVPGLGTLDTFTLVTTDSVGNQVESQVTIKIVDDQPVAVPDFAKLAEGQTAQGNVLNNDVSGADGFAGVIGVKAGADITKTVTTGVGTVIQGLYGELVIGADGTSVYHANANSVGAKGGLDIFTYSVMDKDGDVSTTTLTIKVDDSHLKATNVDGVTVFEAALDKTQDGKDLAPGNTTGSHPDWTSETASGTVAGSVSGGVGALTYSVYGSDTNGDTVGKYGVIHLNADGSYTYTLTSAPQVVGLGTTETFTLVTTDSVGNHVASQLTIKIVDDHPVAVPDFAKLAEGQTAQGNVLNNDVSGADGFAGVIGVKAGADITKTVTTGVGTVIQGLYGELVIGADGTSVYHANANSVGAKGGLDIFTYSVMDKDGDVSTTTLTIKVDDSHLKATNVDGVTVFEAALDKTQDGNDLAPGNTTGSHPDWTSETASGTVAGSVSGGVGALTYSVYGSDTNGDTVGKYGVIHLNADGSYTYTLTSAPQVVGLGTTETFTLVTTDSVGNHVASQLTIKIVDDHPVAVPDFAKLAEGQTAQGNVLNNDVSGADGFAGVIGVKAGADITKTVTTGVGTVIQGLYGELVIGADGTSVYHANANSVGAKGGLDIFTYSVMDKDGDVSTTTLTIKVDDSHLKATNVDGVTVFEAALDKTQDGKDLAPGNTTGSHPDWTQETASGTVAGSVSGGVGALNYSLYGSDSSGDMSGKYGVIHMNADGSYTYTLTSAPTVYGLGTTETFAVVTTDSVGNHVASTLTIKIVDDQPQAYADGASIVEGQTVRGNVLANDVSGADGFFGVVGVKAGGDTSAPVIGGTNTVVQGLYGFLVITADGSSLYHANANAAAQGAVTDTFTYSVADKDGDISTTTVTIDIGSSGLHLEPGNGPALTVAEAALDLNQDGKDLAPGTVVGSDPDSTAETASGSLVGSVSGGVGTITYSIDGAQDGLVHTQYGVIQLNADGSYTYTLTSAPKTDPAANNGNDYTTDSVTYRATDSQGNTITNQLVIAITDDVPQAGAIDRVAIAPEVNSNVLLVIDVSGSMDDPSGVGNLSRLDLAKQAIGKLLDQYDGMGDVKVQIVTFSNGVTIPSNVWVDVATAKAYIATLQANGGTNYDYALSGAETAFSANGKLVGGQNVAYFFSDGDPTLSSTHPTSGGSQSGSQTNPNLGDGIDTTEEKAWTDFLSANDIKAYAIGLGTGVDSQYLNPIAYDGTTGTNTNANVVTDLNNLSGVLSSTVQSVALAGSLLTNGTFGADGGFIKSITVDGVTYTYDPKANNGEGGMTASSTSGHGTFDTSTNSISVATSHGATVVVDMDTGAYTYTAASSGGASTFTDKVTFVLADNDGDTSNPADLSVTVTPNSPPVAVADHVITNVLSSTILVPSEALTANDTDANGDPLTVVNTGFDTGWAPKGADFTAATVQTLQFNGVSNTSSNQVLTINRSDFNISTSNMTALLVVSGFLGTLGINNSANASDTLTVHLKAGESLNLSDTSNSHLNMTWQLGNGATTTLGDGGVLTATTEGDYTIHISHAANHTGQTAYTLDMSINYAGAANYTPDLPATYTVSDTHGGSDTAAATITYQDGYTLTGTAGDDILISNDSGSTLLGLAGNDFMIGGKGNDTFDGGAGVNTVSYHAAKGPVTVDLSITTAQDTVSAGQDTLNNIQNLIGSDYGDHLTGNAQANVITGGVGNDVINGGGGNDTLIGGLGDNTLTGGDGADTFKYLAGNSGHDTITDFTVGTDKLDLSQLLQGDGATASTLDDYLHFKVTGSGSGLVSSIDVSTTAGGAATQTIDLQGVNLASHYGVTPGSGGTVSSHDTATIISGMLGDHSLKVDVA
ncbi:retention module-containing protein [Pseudomonas eucalypticola]|uniref:Retention module-containing protein n=1 Tax=Pseudomonas eucalypticola TaxID=2599595 RepID=A0A7D5HFG6_9PSED|nr:retention module-containing protein [Pseudomonas eucalypticola]QKZ06230.1 retention module-containing protein [Pseudomonas eucalypticola]